MNDYSADRSPVDIWVVGLGMRTSHLLPETAAILRSSRKVLYLSHAPGVRELLLGYCADVVDLVDLYEDGVDRLATYKRIAATVIDAALQQSPVALGVYGHPLVLSVPSTILLQLGREFGLTVKALPAVSSLDCLQADLGVDLIASGVQMHEATDLLLYHRKLLPELATVLWQVGALEIEVHAPSSPGLQSRLIRLRNWVCDFYPSNHEALAVSSPVDISSEVELYSFQLNDLPDMVDRFHLGTTLYIPPVIDQAVPSAEITSRVRSRSNSSPSPEDT